MTPSPDRTSPVDGALELLKRSLEMDGYLLETREKEIGRYELRVVPTKEACAECLIPQGVMTQIIREALSSNEGSASVSFELVYP